MHEGSVPLKQKNWHVHICLTGPLAQSHMREASLYRRRFDPCAFIAICGGFRRPWVQGVCDTTAQLYTPVLNHAMQGGGPLQHHSSASSHGLLSCSTHLRNGEGEVPVGCKTTQPHPPHLKSTKRSKHNNQVCVFQV